MIRSGKYPARSIIAGEPNESARDALERETGARVTSNNIEVVTGADVLFVGVKPAVVLSALKEVRAHSANKLIISLAAGVRIESMESVIDGRVMRAMTNTPSAICRAATALARGSRTTPGDIEIATQIFSAIGLAVEVPEEQIDAVTALSGSGPAFVYSVIEALAKGGEKTGLSPEVALDAGHANSPGSRTARDRNKAFAGRITQNGRHARRHHSRRPRGHGETRHV